MRAVSRLAVFLALAVAACATKPGGEPVAPAVVPSATAVASAPPPMKPSEIAGLAGAGAARCDVPNVGALLTEKDPSWGNPDAPIVIVEFGDFQCPFCGRSAETIATLSHDLGPDKLRFVFKHQPLPFHDHAALAAEVAQGVFELGGSSAFQRFYGIVYSRQAELERTDLLRDAGDAGVDPAAISDGLDAHRWRAKVQADNDLAQKAGSNGTPHFFVDGLALAGAQPIDKFRETIAQAQDQVGRDGSPGAACRAFVANFANRPPPAPPGGDHPEDDDNAVWRVEVGQSPVRGKADALVTIVEFGDFQCPFCKRVQATLQDVAQKYGDQVRFVWKDEPLPFHPRALPSARLARTALATKGVAAFWQAHDELFDLQPKLENGDLTALGRKLGLSAGSINAALSGKAHEAEIDADQALADAVQATGTPHFFINGRRLVGAQPIDKFSSVIDEELAKAKQLVANGTPASQVYATIIKNGKNDGDTFETKKIAAAPNAPSRGARNARATMQICSDFQCPFCKRLEPTLKTLLDEFPGKLRIVWRDLPLPMHPDAPLAAEAAREAFAQKGNAGFWAMHDRIFEAQGTEGGLKQDALVRMAGELGLDVTKFQNALADHRHKAAVDADAKACTDAGVSGTPGTITNGLFVSGAQPVKKFERVIKKALR